MQWEIEPGPGMDGFIAQLVEHRTGNVNIHGFKSS